MQAFIDESGGKGQSRIFTMAGWLAPAEQWQAFSARWAECLSSPPRIASFKMREAASLSGHFRGMAAFERDAKLFQLAGIVSDHATVAISCSVDLSALADTIATGGKPFADPYFWPFHITIMAIVLDLVERGATSPAEVTFDEHAIFGERAKRWYPLVRSYMAHQDPADGAVMPDQPTFRSDLDALPLQAADMLAWLIRRSAEHNLEAIERWETTGRLERDKPHDGDFSWLAYVLRRVPASSQVQFLTRRRLNGIMELIEQHLHDDFAGISLPPGYLEAYREVLSTALGRPIGGPNRPR